MDIAYMRKRINDCYDGKWTALYDMPNSQIIAIYFQMRNSGKFDKNNTKTYKDDRKFAEVQLSIFEMPEYKNSIDKANVY